MRTLLVLLLIAVTLNSYAQKHNTYFFKNDGREVSTSDSADYMRIVSEPDSGSKLFNVKEYYASHKVKLLGKSEYTSANGLDGVVVEYFENGKRKSVINHYKGYPVDSAYYYYPNGQMYMFVHYTIEAPTYKTFNKQYLVDKQFDSLGHATVIHGNGTYKGYNDRFTQVTEEGQVKDGKREGEWRGTEMNGAVSFNEQYSNGELISGQAMDKAGNSATYSKIRNTGPDYPGGITNFYNFLAHQVRYPKNARENGIQGRVEIQFKINQDGTLSNISIIQSVSPDLDAECIRVIKLCPPWNPATICGYKTTSYFSTPMQFTMPRN